MCEFLKVNRKGVLKIFNKTEQNIQEDLEILREWLKQQPHLPYIDDARLEAILLLRKFSIERAKQTIDGYFTTRTEHPEFYENRDPCSEEFRKSYKVVSFFPLKCQTENFQRITITRIFNPDPKEIDGVIHAKYNFLTEEAFLQYDYCNGHQVIFDLIGVKLIHLSIFTPALLAKSTKIHLDAYGFRIAGIHILNPPPFMDTIVVIMKTFLKDKIIKRLQIHNDLDSLHSVFSKKLLPFQYGGECGDLYQIRDEWQEFIESMRPWFLTDEKLKTDESKRPMTSNGSYLSDSVQGTFKKLNID
ncbi:alpha-tocopherol transfer protein-like [Chrysoperla carnea]|uniref:alpha-tocopherol transfer protein-like n=1 Tax=Chrysoperla carnea TaxID=189513 RepID=UPI001D07A151|nr:alpha-tocopherol transfer protein-like [Chrysoperla carnea]